jgi:aryl-alcohol dehydrogenase-like predicted oxidoreductase
MGDRAKGTLSEPNFAVLTQLEDFAQQRGHTMIELAIGWLASHPFVPSVIAGATKPEQVEQNARAGEWRLTPDEMAEVDRITKRPE